jgi:hypothetical protein
MAESAMFAFLLRFTLFYVTFYIVYKVYFFIFFLLLQYFSRKLRSQQGDFQAGPTISIKIQIKLHYNSIYKKYV